MIDEQNKSEGRRQKRNDDPKTKESERLRLLPHTYACPPARSAIYRPATQAAATLSLFLPHFFFLSAPPLNGRAVALAGDADTRRRRRRRSERAAPARSAATPARLRGGAAPPHSNLRGLIAAKEKELHDINEYRIQTLESLLQEKERDINDGKHRLAKLKEDFQYNLRLLEERDAELERYDSSFNHLKALVRDRDIEISELKIASAELQHAVKQERDRANESEAYYQAKLAAVREEGEAARWKLEDELREQRADFDARQRDSCRCSGGGRGARARAARGRRLRRRASASASTPPSSRRWRAT